MKPLNNKVTVLIQYFTVVNYCINCSFRINQSPHKSDLTCDEKASNNVHVLLFNMIILNTYSQTVSCIKIPTHTISPSFPNPSPSDWSSPYGTAYGSARHQIPAVAGSWTPACCVHSCFLPKADRFMLEAFTSLVRDSRLPVIRVLGNRSIDPTCNEDLIIKYCAF